MGSLQSLSDKDQVLIRNAFAAHEKAAGLLAWWRHRKTVGALRQFELAMPKDRSIKLQCFYDTMTLDGKETSVMACAWKSRFRCSQSGVAGCSMASFIESSFLSRACWVNPNHLPGGIKFIPLQYKLRGQEDYGVFAAEAVPPALNEIGSKYEWLVMNAVVNDFFLSVPGVPREAAILKRMPIMASYILVHPDYLSSFFEPLEGTAAECSFGYSFLPIPVNKSVFGYGPGMFSAALKQFRWTLLENSDVEVQMFFLVAPRSQKILSLWGGFDPVYSTVDLLNALTLNRGFGRWARDKMDAFQLQVHARVYQSLLEGMRACWEEQDWIAAVTKLTSGQAAAEGPT